MIADASRLVIVALGAVLLGQSFAVFVKYAAQVRESLRRGSGRARPLHVAGISLSYCLFVVGTADGNLQALLDGLPATRRTVVFIVAELLGVLSLSMILVHLARTRDDSG